MFEGELLWLGENFGIWLHDYWPFYAAIVIGAIYIKRRFDQVVKQCGVQSVDIGQTT